MTATATIRTPDDLLAMVPYVMGFHPRESLVLLTFGTDSFHARLDLPQSAAEASEAAACLAGAVEQNHARTGALVLLTEDPGLAEVVWDVVVPALCAAGLALVDVLRADGHRWSSRSAPERWADYDVTNHPLAAQAVYDGGVALSSREELAASLEPDDVLVQSMARRLQATTLPTEQGWLQAVLQAHAASGGPLGEQAAAQAILLMQDPATRDQGWCWLRRAQAAPYVEVLRDLLRRTPPDLVGSVAAVTAFAAWLAGNGALAWCAIDRAEQADPGNSLARLVSDLLQQAISPRLWEQRVCRSIAS